MASWSTAIKWTDTGGTTHRLATWLGPKHLYGWKNENNAGRWIGNLPESEILSAERHGGYPDCYEVTPAGALSALAAEFSRAWRDSHQGTRYEPNIDALEETIRGLPTGATLQIEAWDQS